MCRISSGNNRDSSGTIEMAVAEMVKTVVAEMIKMAAADTTKIVILRIHT
jgi:hypothetical protein